LKKEEQVAADRKKQRLAKQVRRGKDASRTIADNGKMDAAVLTKRAAAYLANGQWDLAHADWRKAVEQQPNLAYSAFDEFKRAERWSEAAEFGLKLIEQKPEDSLWWLKVASVLAMDGDATAYNDFCTRESRQFKKTKGGISAERLCKICLLKADSINLAELPQDALTNSDGDATTSGGPWFWGTQALLSYRRGDLKSAVKYVNKSNELNPSDSAYALNQAVLAMTQNQFHHPDEARHALDEASQLIARLKRDPKNKGDHNVLIAEILFHEAEEKINRTSR
jgi:tetratricopeptide (TPR) repeat protein